MSEQDSAKPAAAPDDRELEAFLARQSPLSQAYRQALPPDRLPDNVDAAVRAWAKREHEQHLGPGGRWWDRAALPLGAAASLILVALLVNKGRESGVSERAAIHEAQTASATPAAKVQTTRDSKPAVAPAATAPSTWSEGIAANLPARSKESIPSQAAAQPSPPPPAVAEAPARQPLAAVEDRSAATLDAANAPAQRLAGSLSSSGNTAEEKVQTAPPPAPAPIAAKAAPAPFPAAPPATAGAAASIKASRAESSAVASDAQLQACERADVPDLDPQHYPAQSAWLDGIRSLGDAAGTEAARRQLRCWKRVYPQSVLPEDLKDLSGG